ncbi:hypothetical protein EXIGLDRAFT_759300 [Exidia glandulosa HHB12029]|uniref:Uncharacterized protein n=1 Tax=Exidia glandulosa HHB12029 TaxID=1314781 RepID=A0A165Q2I3_EXIGL|nr:hypothetical protein EXIGLDRAFT_759300 [Exidia glandulosa HHB12029]
MPIIAVNTVPHSALHNLSIAVAFPIQCQSYTLHRRCRAKRISALWLSVGTAVMVVNEAFFLLRLRNMPSIPWLPRRRSVSAMVSSAALGVSDLLFLLVQGLCSGSPDVISVIAIYDFIQLEGTIISAPHDVYDFKVGIMIQLARTSLAWTGFGLRQIAAFHARVQHTRTSSSWSPEIINASPAIVPPLVPWRRRRDHKVPASPNIQGRAFFRPSIAIVCDFVFSPPRPSIHSHLRQARTSYSRGYILYAHISYYRRYIPYVPSCASAFGLVFSPPLLPCATHAPRTDAWTSMSDVSQPRRPLREALACGFGRLADHAAHEDALLVTNAYCQASIYAYNVLDERVMRWTSCAEDARSCSFLACTELEFSVADGAWSSTSGAEYQKSSRSPLSHSTYYPFYSQ